MTLQTVRKYLPGGAGQLHYREIGKEHGGAPLVCLHQSPKSSLEFESFMQAAGRSQHVIAFDYPGCGMSDCPPSEHIVTIPYYANVIANSLDSLQIEQVDLFGNHTGAMVAASLADTHPDRVGAIAMISAPILTDEETRDFEDYFVPVPLDLEGTRFLQSWTRVVKHAGPGMTLDMLARSFMQNTMAGDAYEWGHAAAFAWGGSFAETLSRLEHPILVLNPADDLEIYTTRAEQLLRNGTYLARPDWGHGLLDTQTADLSKIILSFLKTDASKMKV